MAVVGVKAARFSNDLVSHLNQTGVLDAIVAMGYVDLGYLIWVRMAKVQKAFPKSQPVLWFLRGLRGRQWLTRFQPHLP